MKVQDWIFSVRYAPEGERDFCRRAVVGPARASTVEAALHLAGVPEAVRVEIRAEQAVRDFIDGRLDPDRTGYYVPSPMPASSSWLICIGAIHEVIR